MFCFILSRNTGIKAKRALMKEFEVSAEVIVPEGSSKEETPLPNVAAIEGASILSVTTPVPTAEKPSKKSKKN